MQEAREFGERRDGKERNRRKVYKTPKHEVALVKPG
jgi:hypothetical protein